MNRRGFLRFFGAASAVAAIAPSAVFRETVKESGEAVLGPVTTVATDDPNVTVQMQNGVIVGVTVMSPGTYPWNVSPDRVSIRR